MDLVAVEGLLEDLHSVISGFEVNGRLIFPKNQTSSSTQAVNPSLRRRVGIPASFEVPVLDASSASIYEMIAANVPFLVTGDEGAFSNVVEAWTTPTPGDPSSASASINLPHLVDTYGSWDVPVKKNLNSGVLDADGRAVEPECVTVTMNEWVEQVSDNDDIMIYSQGTYPISTYPTLPTNRFFRRL